MRVDVYVDVDIDMDMDMDVDVTCIYRQIRICIRICQISVYCTDITQILCITQILHKYYYVDYTDIIT